MDNSGIRQQINFIKEKLKKNAVTFVLDDSARLIDEMIDLQRMCNHTREDGVLFFDLEDICPICDLQKRGLRRANGVIDEHVQIVAEDQ